MEQGYKQKMHDALQLLKHSPKLQDMPVADIASMSITDPRTKALFTLAVGEPFNWSHNHWTIIVNEIDNNNTPLRDWLGAYAKPERSDN